MKLKLDILNLQIKTKKNFLGVFNGSLETYTKCSRVADEEQKKDLRCFWVILLKGAMAFLISLKGAICRKV